MPTPFLKSRWYLSSPLPCSFEVNSSRVLLPLVWVGWSALELHTILELVYLDAGRILVAVPQGLIVLVLV